MVYSKTLKIDDFLAKLPKNSHFLLAFSGGSDSTALLHLCATLANIRAIHINHGISRNADAWQQHCQTICAKLDIELITETLKLPNRSENTCRQARYSAIKQHMRTDEIVLTAHHSGDQAETLLLNLFRGTGLNGLTGMDEITVFHQGYLARPLLNYSATELKHYLLQNHIGWIEDESNHNNHYRRNYLRNKIIPALTKHWPAVLENMSRTANNLKNTELLLKHQCHFEQKYLPVQQLIDCPENMRSSLLYHWLSGKQLPLPDKKTLQHICDDFITAGKDKNPHFSNGFYQLMRWKNNLYCLQNYAMINPQHSFIWDTNTPFALPNHCGFIHYTGSQNHQLVVKFNQTGERLKPLKRPTKTVKQLFQENNISPWHKHNMPYIYQQERLISLATPWSACEEIGQNLVLILDDLLL